MSNNHIFNMTFGYNFDSILEKINNTYGGGITAEELIQANRNNYTCYDYDIEIKMSINSFFRPIRSEFIDGIVYSHRFETAKEYQNFFGNTNLCIGMRILSKFDKTIYTVSSIQQDVIEDVRDYDNHQALVQRDIQKTIINLRPTEFKVESVADRLEEYQQSAKIILEYLSVIVPTKNSGGIDNNNNFDYSYANGSDFSDLGNPDFYKFNCYFYTYSKGQVQHSMYLPVYPNEVTDSNTIQYTPTPVLGRSVAYQTYNTTGRKVDFTLELHEELCNNPNYIRTLVRYLESLCYPEYDGIYVEPPEVSFHIGNHFKIRGIIDGSVTVNWKAPIIDGRLVNCSISISITETTGPYTMSEVANMGGYRSEIRGERERN